MYQEAQPPQVDVQPRKRKGTFLITLILLVLAVFAGMAIGQSMASGKSIKFSSSDSELDLSLFNEVLSIIQNEYVDTPVDEKSLEYGAIRGLVAGIGDANSNFMDPEETKSFQENLSGQFEGIGIEIAIRDEVLTVVAPLPDSPAETAGLLAGDQIIGIDDQDTASMTLDQAVIKIRGEKGTQVKLYITRKDSFENKEFVITRDTISVDSVSYEVREDGIGVISMRRFGEDTTDLMAEATSKFLEANVKGIILDLRNNPGGFLETSVDIAGYFVSDSVIVTEEFGDDTKQEYRSNGQALLKDMPLVILVDEGSASASEILAGALQDYKKATLVGVKTFGKGSVQELKSLKDQTSLRITVAKFVLPKGRHIDKKGIEPDVQVEITKDDIANDRDPQFDKALEILKK